MEVQNTQPAEPGPSNGLSEETQDLLSLLQWVSSVDDKLAEYGTAINHNATAGNLHEQRIKRLEDDVQWMYSRYADMYAEYLGLSCRPSLVDRIRGRIAAWIAP